MTPDTPRSTVPEEYESSLPVHQDGTCNGLQHYAALGGDVGGANAVNLATIPDDDRPQDVYMAVVDRVNQMINAHAAGDVEGPGPWDYLRNFEDQEVLIASARRVAALGPVQRKTVKQTIMTSVYGVTLIGARDQVAKQLRAKKYSEDQLSDDELFETAGYLAACTFSCLESMFQQAHEIKTWLASSAYQVSQSGAPVTWITPVNLPVIQPYHKLSRSRVDSPLQSICLAVRHDVKMPPEPSKQRSAFPPNYVHSLDSTHMMYTANACNEDSVRFVSVHDSYWTHAATVDIMSAHCRQQFVRLHSQPLLPRLYEFFNTYYNGREYEGPSGKQIVQILPPPKRGDFDLNEVLAAKYFFS